MRTPAATDWLEKCVSKATYFFQNDSAVVPEMGTVCGVVVFLWRLLNPHMLTQALLVSLIIDKQDQWVQMTRYYCCLQSYY